MREKDPEMQVDRVTGAQACLASSRPGPSESDVAGGYREVLGIAVPLILSTAALTVNLFVDRMFLSWYGSAAVAAAVPAGIAYFTICSFFLGTAQYVNSIVAQFYGAGNKKACARVVWQGVFFSLFSVPLMLGLIPAGLAVISMSGHPGHVMELEKEYFSILMLGGAMLPLNAALSSFFSGRGRTAVVMIGNVAGNAANVILAYVLIFGKLGFPEMGIRGAGWATALTGVIPAVYWGLLFLSPRFRSSYGIFRQCRWDPGLFIMLLRYGIPAGVQFALDMAAFSAFVFLVGRLGEIELAASNIVVSIEMLAFLPMVGMSMATATLVGQYIGREKLPIAERTVRSALRLALGYMGLMSLLFLLFPDTFIGLFRSRTDIGAGFEAIAEKGAVILRLVAVYTIFDTLFIIYSGALRGAGDTRFAMWVQILIAWLFFVPSVYVVLERMGLGLTPAWICLLLYALSVGGVFRLRFRKGHWKNIRMIGRP